MPTFLVGKEKKLHKLDVQGDNDVSLMSLQYRIYYCTYDINKEILRKKLCPKLPLFFTHLVMATDQVVL